jgi:hypothetical protein
MSFDGSSAALPRMREACAVIVREATVAHRAATGNPERSHLWPLHERRVADRGMVPRLTLERRDTSELGKLVRAP